MSGDHPDWARVLVNTGASTKPVGDPTRWGSSTFTLLTAPPALGDISTASVQVLEAGTRDAYSRSWALNGTLSLPEEFWGVSAPANVATRVSLQVQMGVGQAQVLHEICLFDSTLPGGLCWDQALQQGGPYVPYETAALGPGTATDLTFAFSAIGALIGHTLNIRSKYVFGNLGLPMPQFPTRSLINVVLTPFAAGEGL